jgi:hypothetical protein
MLFLNRRVVMSITYPVFQKANFYPEKYGGETFLADAGQRLRPGLSRLIDPIGRDDLRVRPCTSIEIEPAEARQVASGIRQF